MDTNNSFTVVLNITTDGSQGPETLSADILEYLKSHPAVVKSTLEDWIEA